MCRILRYESDVPILLVGPDTRLDDLLFGLDIGADDCLTKPYRKRELLARTRNLLRRTRARARHTDTVHEVGDLRVDTTRHEVHLASQPIDITPTEFRLLTVLASEPGRAFDRQSLLEAAFGFDYDVLERTIDVHIVNLRKKLETEPANPERLLTVLGVGHRLADETDPPPS